MSSFFILLIIACYFGLLVVISLFTGKEDSNEVFFKAKRQSPWYVVAFGMVGASLSGVTFISVPGWVEASKFSYMQVVLGYMLGYFLIGAVLLPLYYRLNLTSIYSYLGERFGVYSYKTGASFFLLSRLMGATLRIFLTATVLQLLVFDEMGIPFWITVTLTITLIWLYTHKGGIKTVVWTDTLQTLFMLLSVGFVMVTLYEDLHVSRQGLFSYIYRSEFSKLFFFEDYKSADYFWKQFFSGAFIAVTMTGLDQDMMQKNLTCRSLKDAQKNMFWFTIVVTVVNLAFLALGLLLTVYAQQHGLDVHRDSLFPYIAKNKLGGVVFMIFLIGLIAAAYSSADSSLTALTTSFSVDILGIEKNYDAATQVRLRKRIHITISILVILLIIGFREFIKDESIIAKIFIFAGYTYGPLLGLYSFGLFTRWQVKDKWVPLLAVGAPILSYLIGVISKAWFDFGFFILILNGGITFLGLVLLRSQKG